MTTPNAEWRRVLETSESADVAQIRIAHAMLTEIRAIKTMLAWGMFGIPAAALVVLVIVLKA